MDTKKRLARSIVSLLYGESEAEAAQADFEITHQSRTPRSTPDETFGDLVPMPAGTVDVFVDGFWAGENCVLQLPQLLNESGFASSVGAARDLVRQGAVRRVGATTVLDPEFYTRRAPEVLSSNRATLRVGDVIRVGSHRFFRVQRKSTNG